MSTINHRLRPYQRKDGTHQIQVIYSHGQETPIYFSIQYGCLPEHFDKESGRVSEEDIHHDAVNRAIFKLERKIYAAVNQLMDQDKEPSPSRVKSLMEGNDKKGGLVLDAFDAYRQHLRDIGRKEATVDNVDGIERMIQQYEALHKCNLGWKDIDGTFAKELKADLMSGRVKNRCRLSDSTVKSYLGRFQSYVDWAKSAGYHRENEYFTLQVEAKSLKNNYKEKPALYPDEIEALKALEFDEEEAHMRLAVDKLLFAIEVSLRISDIHGSLVKGEVVGGIRRSDIKEVEVKDKKVKCISIVTKKSEKETLILLTPYAQEIIDRQPEGGEKIFEYQGTSYISKLLKEAGCRAGLDRPYRQTYKKGGKLRIKEGPIWSFLSSHVGRISYGFNWTGKGGTVEGLQAVYGHSSIATTEKHYRRFDKMAALADQLKVSEL